MASVLAVCFRCDWTGEEDSSLPEHRCPRCGVPLYLEPAAPPPALDESPQLQAPEPLLRPDGHALDWPDTIPAEPEGEPPPDDPNAANARRALGMAVVIILALVFMGLINQREVRPQANETRPETADLGAVTRHLALPSDTTAALTPHADSVTFVAAHTPKGKAVPVTHLWRLVVPTGELLPGPVVSEVRELQADPRPNVDRVAYLVDGGGLFSLSGFDHEARPTWISGGVAGFEFSSDGSLAYVVEQQLPPREGRSRVQVTAVQTDRVRHSRADSSFTTALDVGPTRGLAVRSSGIFVWGAGAQGSSLVALSPYGWREVWPLQRSLIDVGPNGEVLALSDSERDRSVAVIASKPSASFRPLNANSHFIIRSPLAWSRKGSMIAVIGRSEADKREGLWAVPARPRTVATKRGEQFTLTAPVWAGPANPGHTFAAFSANGRLLFWTSGNAIRFLDLRTEKTFRINLPPHLQTTGPITAA